MTAAVILALLPLSVSAASCKHSYGGAKWSEASHPHEYFYYCEKGCGSKQYTGTYMTKSNCAVCNPELSKWLNVDTSEMPPIYTPSNKVYLLKMKDGTMAAIRLVSYMNAAGTKGYMTFDYLYPYEP